MTTDSLTFDSLLQHERFVRDALRGLLRDPATIDDTVQETWLRALQHGRLPAEARSWLGRVARNLAVSRWRSERRRRGREQAVAQAGGSESPEQVQRRVEMRQQVVAAILALDEPYRSVVLLRYERGLAVAEISHELGRGHAAVQKQLQRAHAQLRERLDERFGGRERWLLMAAPLLPFRRATASSSLAVAAGGVVLAGLGALAWQTWESPSAPTPFGEAQVRTLSSSAAATEFAAASRIERRAAVPVDEGAPRSSTRHVERQAAALLDRSYYDDYEAATFSLLHGVRDDADLTITGNDWDVQLQQGRLQVCMVTDDSSTIADLGPIGPREFGMLPPMPCTFAEKVAVVAGHAYFVHTRDNDSELASVLFVTANEPDRRCAFDWFSTDGSGCSQGSVVDPGGGCAWIDVLSAMRQQHLAQQPRLQQPFVRWQLRGGAGGGNPRRIALHGTTDRVDTRSAVPIDVATPVSMRDEATAYGETGHIPPDCRLVVTRVDYRGANPGDGNGPGGFRVVLGGEAIVDVPPGDTPIDGVWTGRVVLQPGDEARTFFEICNSSQGEVRLCGTFEPVPPGPRAWAENRGFGEVHPGAAALPTIGIPRVRLQLRGNRQNGGNPCRIDLRSRRQIYVDRLTDEPVACDGELPDGVRVLAFGDGGVLPESQQFVVTAVHHRFRIGEQGSIRVVVAGQEVVAARDPIASSSDTFRGALTIVPGEECRSYIEITGEAWLDVELTGWLANR